MPGHVIRSPISRVREVTAPFCSALLIHFCEFCVQFWVLYLQKNTEKLEHSSGKQPGRADGFHNLCYIFAHTMNVHWLSSGPCCARSWEDKCEQVQAPALVGRTMESTGCLHITPKEPSWAEGWSLWDSIRPEKTTTTGVSRQWHRGWIIQDPQQWIYLKNLQESQKPGSKASYPGEKSPNPGHSPGLGKTTLLTAGGPKARAHAADTDARHRHPIPAAFGHSV